MVFSYNTTTCPTQCTCVAKGVTYLTDTTTCLIQRTCMVQGSDVFDKHNRLSYQTCLFGPSEQCIWQTQPLVLSNVPVLSKGLTYLTDTTTCFIQCTYVAKDVTYFTDSTTCLIQRTCVVEGCDIFCILNHLSVYMWINGVLNLTDTNLICFHRKQLVKYQMTIGFVFPWVPVVLNFIVLVQFW